MGKTFTDRSQRRISDSVRYTEAEQRNLAGPGRPPALVPHDICRFEMVAALSLPQNGPGTSVAYKLRWEPTQTHVGMSYDTLARIGSLPTDSNFDRNAIPAEQWSGDYSGGYPPDDHLERILLLDGLRNHSKMLTEGDDVGAYGVAWKPHDSLARRLYATGEPFWEILTMQTPGRFVGHLQSALTVDTASVTARAFRQDGTSATAGHVTLDGYDPFGPGWIAKNGNVDITVYNPPGIATQYVFKGDNGGVVWCAWNMRLGQYYIYQAECPAVTDGESYLGREYYSTG